MLVWPPPQRQSQAVFSPRQREPGCPPGRDKVRQPFDRIGILLIGIATLGYVLAGLGVFGVPGISEIWRIFAAASAVISLLLLIHFWHLWLKVCVLLDIGILAHCSGQTARW